MSVNPLCYPITIQIRKGYVVATQRELQIHRTRGKFEDIKRAHEIGVIVLDVLDEVMNQMKSNPGLPPPPPPEEGLPTKDAYLTVGKVCKVLGLSPSTVHRMCDRGELKFRTTPKGHRRIYLVDHDLKYLNSIITEK